MSSPCKPALDPTIREFGRVHACRGDLGLSQEAGAIRCHIHWTQLGKVEHSLRLENMLRIPHSLATTPGALLDGLPEPP